MKPDLRSRLVAAQLIAEYERLVALLRALANRAIRTYGNEWIEQGWVLVQECAETFVLDAADQGVFSWFGIIDRGDIVSIPTMFLHGVEPGMMVPDVRELAKLIVHGGTRRVWLKPRDLEFTGDTR